LAIHQAVRKLHASCFVTKTVFIDSFLSWIFQAEAPYELSGLTPNVVFPTGLLLRGDELWMYYGAAGICTCLTTAKLDEVLALLVD